MTAAFRPRSLRPTSLALAVVAACAVWMFGGSRVASASCGDWLEGHAAAHGGSNRLAPVGVSPFGADAFDASSSAARPSSPPLDRPCEGPACRRAPLLPPAPFDAADPLPEVDRALSSVVDACDAPSLHAPRRPGDDASFPPAVPGRLERPPRHG